MHYATACLFSGTNLQTRDYFCFPSHIICKHSQVKWNFSNGLENRKYSISPCIMLTFFAQIFEGKIRMHKTHGHNNGYNNPMYNVHKNMDTHYTQKCIIHSKIRYTLRTSGPDGGVGRHGSPFCTTVSKLQLNYRTTITQNRQKSSWMEVWQLQN